MSDNWGMVCSAGYSRMIHDYDARRDPDMNCELFPEAAPVSKRGYKAQASSDRSLGIVLTSCWDTKVRENAISLASCDHSATHFKDLGGPALIGHKHVPKVLGVEPLG